MKRWPLKGPILIATFSAGFGLATLRLHRKPINSAVTFSCDGIVSSFRTHYHSSDGKNLRYACYEHASLADAERYLQDEIRPNYKYVGQTPVQIVERTVTLDAQGNKTGERAVLDDGELLWAEGPRVHLIQAPSVEYALLFESSRSWAWEGCWKIPARDNDSE
jgi:hypothetical protein